MKKIISFILLAALLCTLLCACGEKAGFSEADLSLTVDGTSVTAKTTVAELLAAFGEDYAYSEAISCVYEGMDKTFSYENVELYTYPDGEDDCLMEIYCVGGNVVTSKGITFGASREDVVAKYGKGFVEQGSVLSYELPLQNSENVPASLYFVIADGKVTAIAMTLEHRAE